MAEADARLRSLNGGGSWYKSPDLQRPKQPDGLIISLPNEVTRDSFVQHVVEIKTSLIVAHLFPR